MNPVSHEFSDGSKSLGFFDDDLKIPDFTNLSKEEVINFMTNNVVQRDDVATYFYFDSNYVGESFFFKNGKLNNNARHAYEFRDYDNDITIKKWYLDGEEITEEQHNINKTLK